MAKGRKGTRRRGGSPSSLIPSAATEDSFSSSASTRAPQQGQSAERERKERGKKLKIQSTTDEGQPSMLDQPVKATSKKGKSLQLLCRDGDCKEVPTAKKRRACRMIQMQQVPQSPDTHKSSGESVDQEPPPIGRNPLRRSITEEHLMEALRQANEELKESCVMYNRENALLNEAFEALQAQYGELWKMYLSQKNDVERLFGLVRQLCLRFASSSGDPKFLPPSFPSDDGSGDGGGKDESDSDV